MARQYGYFWLSDFLIKSGADVEVTNNDGHAANTGIEGDQSSNDFVAALTDAHDMDELNASLDGLSSASGVDKAALVMAGMQKKKSAKALWTADIQARFQEIVKSI